MKVVICECCSRQCPMVGDDSFCHNCGLLHHHLYDDSIYNVDYRDKYIKLEASEANSPLQKIRWDIVLSHSRSGRLLDVGCGVGAFIKARPDAFEVAGQDINLTAVEYCQSQGLAVTRDLPSGEFDVVTMFDVIEHLPSLTCLKPILKLLVNRGFLVVTTPNFRDEICENLSGWRHYRPYEHVFLFTERSMIRIAEKFELELKQVSFEESKVRQPAGNIATYVFQKV